MLPMLVSNSQDILQPQSDEYLGQQAWITIPPLYVYLFGSHSSTHNIIQLKEVSKGNTFHQITP